MVRMMLSLLLVVVFVTVGCEAQVSCGGHHAAACKDCPQGHGSSWCNGDCAWCQDSCQVKTKPCSDSQVSCGGHHAAACKDCPQGHGSSWCNGDCAWCKDSCQVKTKPCSLSVDGHWNQWSGFTPCLLTCGEGKKVRYRQCCNPPPSNGGKQCQGEGYQTKQCISKPCIVKVNGNWSPWTSYSSCSQTCDTGEKTRTRVCNNPAPANGGSNCQGPTKETQACTNSKTCSGADFHGCSNLKTTYLGVGWYKVYDQYKVIKDVSLYKCCTWCAGIRSREGKVWNYFEWYPQRTLWGGHVMCWCKKNARVFTHYSPYYQTFKFI